MTDKHLNTEVYAIINSGVPNRHSLFQLNFFVIGKEPTHQAKLWRCVEELKSRQKMLDGMVMEIEELHDKNELLYLRMSRCTDAEGEIKCRMMERRIQANNRTVDDLRSRIVNVEEEMVFFVEAFKKLNEISPQRPWDDVEVQTEYWNAKLEEDVKYRAMMRLPIDAEIVKTIMALPGECETRKRLTQMLKKEITNGRPHINA